MTALQLMWWPVRGFQSRIPCPAQVEHTHFTMGYDMTRTSTSRA